MQIEMESMQQARKLYFKCNRYQASLTDDDKNKLEADIQRFIGVGIKEVPPKILFRNQPLLDILKRAVLVRERDNSDVTPVARGFTNLEKYFLLLTEQPWKPEFKKLKMYGGFYRTKIKSVIPECEEIFQLAGYTVSKESFIMVFQGSLDKNAVLELAFDCKVCSVECKIIAETYKKMKNLSKSLSDAMSYVLHDEWTREKAVSNYGFRHENSNHINNSSNSKVDVPSPAVPERAPITNGSSVRQNVRYEAAVMPSGNGMYDSTGLHLTERQFKERLAFPPKSPGRQTYSGPYIPLASSKAPNEVFPYIDADGSEIIPELPQGTSEEHMRESLKLVNQQEAPRQLITGSSPLYNESQNKYEDWSKYQCQVKPKAGGSIPLSLQGGNLQSDIDEGIEMDPSASAKYVSPKFMGQQAIQPSKPSFQQSFDQGYRTGPESLYGQGQHQPVYQPPIFIADGHSSSGYGSSGMSRQGGAPPPIPSRSLKPAGNPRIQGEDAMSSLGFSRMQSPAPNQPSAASQIGVSANKSLTSALPVQSNTEPIMRKDRLISSKSASLKYPQKSPVQQAAQSRFTRSMDLTANTWYCHACTAANFFPDKTCSICGTNRPVSGEPKKVCRSCTLMNDCIRTHCDACSTLLPDECIFANGIPPF